jgi:hypothetical protein
VGSGEQCSDVFHYHCQVSRWLLENMCLNRAWSRGTRNRVLQFLPLNGSLNPQHHSPPYQNILSLQLKIPGGGFQCQLVRFCFYLRHLTAFHTQSGLFPLVIGSRGPRCRGKLIGILPSPVDGSCNNLNKNQSHDQKLACACGHSTRHSRFFSNYLWSPHLRVPCSRPQCSG